MVGRISKNFSYDSEDELIRRNAIEVNHFSILNYLKLFREFNETITELNKTLSFENF